VKAYVLDAEGELQAPGMLGELCLEGPSLSPGYLDGNDRQAFIHASLFGKERRLYRTGDAAKLDPQGRLQFVGRIDNQVKVRGHRVELDEVSAAVRRHFRVRDVATIFDPASQHLRTFVVTDGRDATADTVLQKLRSTLPAYMVPQQVLVLDDLPRLPNGKIDTGLLPVQPVTLNENEPDDETFRATKAVWCDVLGIDNVPLDVGFFELGGHSLMAARMMLQLQDVVGSQFPLAAIYEHQTLRAFYSYLRRDASAKEQKILYPARPTGTDTPIFVVKTYLNHLLDLIDADVPVFGLRHDGESLEEDVASLENLAARYLDAARQQQPKGPYKLLGFSFGALLAIEIAHQIIAAGDEVELLVLIDPPPPTPEGDTRFLANRALSRVRASESRAGQLRAAFSELRRITRRRIVNLRFRTKSLIRRLFRQQSTSETRGWASKSWDAQARRAYTHKPYRGAALLLLMGREDIESDEQQLARWDDILDGETTAQVIHGPSDHVGLMEPPWIDQVGVAINSALQASRRDENAAQ
jgi:thioesterase domain-containing protein